MSVETLITVLQWAVPGGIVGAVTWLVSREVRHASTAKKVHDTYKKMYEDVSATLTELRQDNDRLYAICTRLEQALTRASVCRYWPQCPIHDELQNGSHLRKLGAYNKRQRVGTHRARDTSHGDDDGAGGLGGSEDSADEPPNTAPRR